MSFYGDTIECGMLNEHRKAIQSNYSLLVNECNIELLLPHLMQRRVFPESWEHMYAVTKDRTRKAANRKLFFDIEKRGPKAFNHLIESLRLIGQSYLADALLGKKEDNQPIPYTNKVFRLAVNDEASAVYDFSNIENALHEDVVPMRIIVEKSKKFYDTGSELVYRSRSRNRGKVLIINNINFLTELNRRGAKADGINLRNLFIQMGLEVDYYEDKSQQQMVEIITYFSSQRKLREYDITIVAFMSHGNITESRECTVTASDGLGLSTMWIEEQFNNEMCKHLRDKPKWFIYQICRSPENTAESVLPNFTPPTNEQGLYSDMLIAHSTLPGSPSHRDILNGAWYIQLICKVFKDHAHDKPLEILLKLVDIYLREKPQSGPLQTSTFLNVGFKNFYFHPGIYEENGTIRDM